MDIYFCDCCAARVTDADLRRGHGVQKGDIVVCSACIERGEGTDLLRQASERVVAVKSALAGEGVLDEVRDRVATLADDTGSDGTGPVQPHAETAAIPAKGGESAGFSDTGTADVPLTRDDEPESSTDLSNAASGFAALSPEPVQARNDAADDLASGANPVLDEQADDADDVDSPDDQADDDHVQIEAGAGVPVVADGDTYEDDDAAALPPQGAVDTVIGMAPLKVTADDVEPAARPTSTSTSSRRTAAASAKSRGSKSSSRGNASGKRSGSGRNGGSDRSRGGSDAGRGGNNASSRRATAGSNRGKASSGTTTRTNRGGSSASRKKKKNQQVLLMSGLSVACLIVIGLIAMSLGDKGKSGGGSRGGTSTPQEMRFRQSDINSVRSDMEQAANQARAALEGGGNREAALQAVTGALNRLNDLIQRYNRWERHLVSQGMSEDEAANQLSGLDFSMANRLRKDLGDYKQRLSR